MQEEVSHGPPVSIYLNLFNDNNTTNDYNNIYMQDKMYLLVVATSILSSIATEIH